MIQKQPDATQQPPVAKATVSINAEIEATSTSKDLSRLKIPPVPTDRTIADQLSSLTYKHPINVRVQTNASSTEKVSSVMVRQDGKIEVVLKDDPNTAYVWSKTGHILGRHDLKSDKGPLSKVSDDRGSEVREAIAERIGGPPRTPGQLQESIDQLNSR